MSEWKEIQIQDVAIVRGRVGWKGYTIKDLRESGALAIGAGQIDSQNRLDLTHPVYISDEKYFESPEIMVEENDLLIVQRGSLGKVVLIDKNIGRATINPSMVIIKNISINPKYLYYYFCSPNGQKLIFNSASQTGVPMISQEQILKFKIHLPFNSLKLHYIASLLSTCDSVIEKTQSAIAKYKAIKQGMLHDLFTRGIDIKTGKLRPKYEDAPELYKESKLGWIPKEWDIITLLESTYIKGRIGWQGLRAEEFIESGPYLITGTDFKVGSITWDSCYHLSEKRFDEAPSIHIQNGDVLITKDGTIGKIALVSNCPQKAILNSGIFLLRCKIGMFTNQYLYNILCSEIFLKWLAIYQGGSTISHLYQREFEKFTFPVPKMEEQNLISVKIEHLDQQLQFEQSYLQKRQAIKQGLMSDLLSGRKKVKTETLN